MPPHTKGTDVIDKADPRRPYMILRTRLPPSSFSAASHSVHFQLSLFSPTNQTKPFNMASVETQSLESFDRSSRSSSGAAGSLPCSVQRTMGLMLDGPLDEFVINMKADTLHCFSRLDDCLNNVSSDVKALKADVSTLKTLKTDVDTLKADVDTLKADVDTLKADVDTLKADVNTLKADMKDVKQHLVQLESLLTDWITHGNRHDGNLGHGGEGAESTLLQTANPPPQLPHLTVQASLPQPNQPSPQSLAQDVEHLGPPSALYMHPITSSSSLRSKLSRQSFKNIVRSLLGAKKNIDDGLEMLQNEGEQGTEDASPISPSSLTSPVHSIGHQDPTAGPSTAGQQPVAGPSSEHVRQQQADLLDRRIDRSRR
ncbi:hypothetical protein BD414DRAFT_540510 [Trametes punicea]|nr:hypothetical protein BD414DRAFT_540510 [Trametes punicea]